MATKMYKHRWGTGSNTMLFAPGWLSWLPMVWGNYWVIDLDPAYTLAAVSEPARAGLRPLEAAEGGRRQHVQPLA